MRHVFSSLTACPVLAALMLVGCTDEQPDMQSDAYGDETELEVVARTLWRCGRTMGSRAGTDIVIEEAAYPQLLHITVGDGPDKHLPSSHPPTFAIGKTIPENDNYDPLGYTAYHDQYRIENIRFTASTTAHAILDEANSTKEVRSIYSKGIMTGLRVEANTLSPRYDGTGGIIPQAWDNADITTASHIDHLTTKAEFGGDAYIDGKHLFLTLGHVNAMLRLHFAVDPEYDKIRTIDLKSVSIAGTPIITDEHHILTTTRTLICSAYVKPASDYHGNALATIPAMPLSASTTSWTGAIGPTSPFTLQCTYDIYDKDEVSPEHVTRVNVTANNSVTLGRLGAAITAVKAGFYYDLYITINPEYLYVLSEHDNKHMVVE